MTRPCLSAVLSSALLLHPDVPQETSQGPPAVRVARLTILWREGNVGMDAAAFGMPWQLPGAGMASSAGSPPAALLPPQTGTEAEPLTRWAADSCLRWLPGGIPGVEDLVALSGSRCPRPGSASAATAASQGIVPPAEIAIGSRLRTVAGSSTIIHLTRMDDLPRPLRAHVRAMIRQPMSRGEAMFHGSFVLTGLAFDEVRSVTALGPALVKTSAVRDGAGLGAARVERGEAGRLQLGLGPFSLDIPSRLRIGAGARPPEILTRVDVTRSRWPVDSSTAVTAAGYFRDDTVVTFQVSRKGRGHRRDETQTYRSVHLGSLVEPRLDEPGAPTLETARAEHPVD